MSQAYVRIVEQSMTKAERRGLSQHHSMQKGSSRAATFSFMYATPLCRRLIQSHQIPYSLGCSDLNLTHDSIYEYMTGNALQQTTAYSDRQCNGLLYS